MNKEQKTAVVEQIADQIKDAEAVFAVDYRGISVPQAAELRSKLRDADATFRVVKNSLTERAADKAGADALRALLEGPTALTFVHGDAAMAAKALADFARATDTLEFKGGLLGAEELTIDQIKSIARLPARDVLYAQLVGTVGSPLTGLVRGLYWLIAGIAVQLQQIVDQGLLAPGEEPPVDEAPVEEPEADAAEEAKAPEAEEATAEAEPSAESAAGEEAAAEDAAPAEEEPPAEEAPPAEEPTADADNQTDTDNETDTSADGNGAAEPKEEA